MDKHMVRAQCYTNMISNFILNLFADDFVYKKSRPVYTSKPVGTNEKRRNSTGTSSDDVIVVDDDSPGLANGEPPRKQTLREMLAGIPGFSLKVMEFGSY